MKPLGDILVLDLTRLAPGPHCTMMLADLGADVVRIEEVGAPGGRRAAEGGGRSIDLGALGFLERDSPHNPLFRGKRSIGLNLKSAEGREVFLKLAAGADVVVEEFRPGVARRLGIDYPTVSASNERLIWCAITGYGQTGPYAQRAGHDINYLALSGLLSAMGPTEGPPTIPLNLIADYAGGALHAVVGVLAALMARGRTGKGGFVDVSMTEGVMSLLGGAIGFAMESGGAPERGGGLFGGGAPFYSVYATSDGKWIAVGAIEPWFFANLCAALGRPQFTEAQFDRSRWPAMHRAFAEIFRQRTRDAWTALLSDVDACVTPVLTLDELTNDPHHAERHVFVNAPDGASQVAPQPRMSPSPPSAPGPPRAFEHTDEVLAEIGYDRAVIDALRERGAVR